MATLHEMAARAGAHRWSELALWQALGAWAPAAGDPEATVLFDTHAQHAAWRAGQWWDRLPVLAVVDRDALVLPPAGLEPVVAALGGLTTTVARAAAVYRVVLPRIVTAYGGDRALTSPVADGAYRRTLDQVEADAAGDWRAGEHFAQLLLATPAAVDEAAATVAALERLALGHPPGEASQGDADQHAEQRHPDGVDAGQ